MTNFELLSAAHKIAFRHITDRDDIELRDLSRKVVDEIERRVQSGELKPDVMPNMGQKLDGRSSDNTRDAQA